MDCSSFIALTKICSQKLYRSGRKTKLVAVRRKKPCLRKAMTTSRKQPVFMAEMRLSFTHRFLRLPADFLDVCQLAEKSFFDKLIPGPDGRAPVRVL